MATAREMAERLQRVDIYKLAGDIVGRNAGQVEHIQIEQLMQGLGSDGQPLAPSILNDPYFKSREAAERYARWKKRLYPDTPFGAPNLIITGQYHNSIFAQVAGSAIKWGSRATFAGDIQSKYRDKQLGLSPDSRHQVFEQVIRRPLKQAVTDITGLK